MPSLWADDEVLDLALVDADLGLAAARRRTASTCSPGCGLGDDPVGERQQLVGRPSTVAHAAVPPMVSAVTRSVGWPSPTGTPWPSLPHVPGLPMAKSLPSSVDVAQHLRAVADQVALAQRLGDLAVLDQVGLGHAEHEVAGGGVHLAAAELGDVDAVLGARG